MEYEDNINLRAEFSGPDLCCYEAHEVVEMLQSGEVSPTELIDAALKRVSQTGPLINATPTICEERARTSVASLYKNCLLYTSPSPRDGLLSRMPSSA